MWPTLSRHAGQNQHSADSRIPQGTQGPLEAATTGHLGRFEVASKSFGARVSGRLGRAYPDRISAAVRAGDESCGVSVGLAETTCAGQLVPQRAERAARDHTQQAQERTKAPLDHRRMLDAGFVVVMS